MATPELHVFCFLIFFLWWRPLTLKKVKLIGVDSRYFLFFFFGLGRFEFFGELRGKKDSDLTIGRFSAEKKSVKRTTLLSLYSHTVSHIKSLNFTSGSNSEPNFEFFILADCPFRSESLLSPRTFKIIFHVECFFAITRFILFSSFFFFFLNLLLLQVWPFGLFSFAL